MENFRHGTLCRHAAFNTRTGGVLGKTAAPRTSAEFDAFPAGIVVNQPRGKEIHVIADNLSAHESLQVAEFLERHPIVRDFNKVPKTVKWRYFDPTLRITTGPAVTAH